MTGIPFAIGAPRPMCSCVTTADGRSPGSRVSALRRLPGCPVAFNIARLIAYSCGDSRGSESIPTAFPFNPKKEPSKGIMS
jgi:hypothetical protein